MTDAAIDASAPTSTVTVFNCYNEPIGVLTVQFGAAGTVPGYSAGPTPAKYTPGSTTVGRSGSLSAGKFGVGANTVTAAWDSFTGTLTVTIPDPKTTPYSLDDDLVLFLTRNEAYLVTTRGYVIDTFKVVLTNDAGEMVAAD